MRGIVLKDSIRLFGFRDGFGFWFRWSFIEPLELFVWINITHKPWCPYHGFGWNTPNCCDRPKLKTKKQIMKRWEQIKKEIDEEEGVWFHQT